MYDKSGIAYKDVYHPKEKTKIVSLSGIIRAIKKTTIFPTI